MSEAPIGLFDSGVGGLSIFNEIRQLLPNESLVYFADSANAPYGEQGRDFIQKRSLEIISHLVALGCKVIVIACNTATTEAIQFLREHSSIPLIGVEPAIKPAVEFSQSKRVGVLATYRTVNSQRTQQLIELYAADTEVFLQACPGWVEFIEENSNSLMPPELLDRHVTPLLQNNIDTLVLGCTHYPFLREQIKAFVGDEVELIDTGKPVSQQLLRVLTMNELLNSQGRPEIKIGTSLLTDASRQVMLGLSDVDASIVEMLTENSQ